MPDNSVPVAALSASDVAALVFVVWLWLTVAGSDAATRARIARAEDASRTGAEAVLVAAGAASLVEVGFALAQAGHTGPPGRGLLTAHALLSYLFGTGIVAIAVSSVAALLGR